MEVYQVNQMVVGGCPMTIGMAAAGLKKGLTHGGGCQTAKQLTRSASPAQHPLPVPRLAGDGRG